MRRLIVDSDVGFDDILAIAALVKLGKREISLISTVHGCSKAADGARVLQSLFPSSGQLVAGVEETEPPRDEPWVPLEREFMANFWAENLVSTDSPLPPTNRAQEAMKTLLQNSDSEETFDLICLGPLSNLHELLRDDPKLLREKIHSVWIMGGSLEAKGFNFGLDPPAAKAFVTAFHDKIHLLMNEDSGPRIASDAYETSIKELGAANSSLWAKIVQTRPKMVFWDVVCAFAYIHPDSVSMNDFHLTIDDESGTVIPDESSGIVVKRLSNIPLDELKAWIAELL